MCRREKSLIGSFIRADVETALSGCGVVFAVELAVIGLTLRGTSCCDLLIAPAMVTSSSVFVRFCMDT